MIRTNFSHYSPDIPSPLRWNDRSVDGQHVPGLQIRSEASVRRRREALVYIYAGAAAGLPEALQPLSRSGASVVCACRPLVAPSSSALEYSRPQPSTFPPPVSFDVGLLRPAHRRNRLVGLPAGAIFWGAFQPAHRRSRVAGLPAKAFIRDRLQPARPPCKC